MKDFFTKNFRLKLVSLILAISLEVYFVSPHNLLTISVRVPVEFLNVPPTMMIVSPFDAQAGLTAHLKVRGPGPLVQQVQNTNAKFTLRLADAALPLQTLYLDATQLQLPSGVSVVELQPAKIELRLERIVRKELAVTFDPGSEPAKGYRIVSVKTQPAAVTARGPESELRGVSTVSTHEVENFQELRSSQTLELPLRSIGPKTTLNVNFATVEVKISPILAERTLENVLVSLVAPAGVAATVSPTRVRAVVTGEESLIAGIQPADGRFEAVLDGLGPGTHELELHPRFADGVEVLRTEPETVTVTVANSESGRHRPR
jgi:hypothetical protein